MPRAMIDHISTMKLLPSTTNLPKAQDVKSLLGVQQEDINLPVGYSAESMAVNLVDSLYTKVMQRGIHPGHCAVVFNEDAASQLFPPQEGGLPRFVQLVHEKESKN